MSKMTKHRGDDLIFPVWLVFHKNGAVRLCRREPDLSRDERCMYVEAKLPLTLWEVPTLRASIAVDGAGAPKVDLEIACDTIRAALGVDVDLQVVGP